VRTHRAALAATLAAALVLAAACGGSDEPEAVGSDQIENGAVSTPKLADEAVTKDKLAPGAVGTARIEDGAVTEDKLGDGAVASEQLAGDAVDGEKVADESLTGADVDESTLEGVDAATLNGSASYFNEVQSVQQTSSLNGNDRKGPVTATCPDGTTVIAGGASIVTESGTKLPIALTASTSNAGNGWNAEALEIRPVEEGWGLRVVAHCGVLSGG
jgi:hypothetical protein